MSKDLLSIEDRKRLVREGVSKISPRKQAFLYMKGEPESITGPILSAARRGSPPTVAAGMGRCTVSELHYMLELGEAGHPAFREFRDEYVRARSEPVADVVHGIYQDATDLEKRNTATQKLALQVMAPELLEERKESSKQAIQSQHFTVNIQEKFEAIEHGVVEEAEFEEAG